MPYASPRGMCPVCGRPIALTLAGRLRHHQWRPTPRPQVDGRSSVCAGSRQNPQPNNKEN